MSRDEAVERITSALGDRIQKRHEPSERRLYLDLPADAVPDTARLMFDELGARLQTASGVDAPREMEILYHWALDSIGLVVSFRTCVDREHPEIESITPVCPAAEWIEREMWELLGISFTGHPDLRHLVLQDDWPEGQFPLRRDYRKDQNEHKDQSE